jgi:hypothetical protein
MQVRLILYYPVSALVTLFANILQNPNDTRARSDVKLMNVVVNFLSTLVSDESNGSVRRMLGLCGEFERITRVVIDKAEKDSSSKKKRKTGPDEGQMPQNIPPGNRTQSHAAAPSSAGGQQPPTTSFSPQMFQGNLGGTAPMQDPNMNPTSGLSGDLPSNVQSMSGLGQDFQDMLSPNNLAALGFPDQQTFADAGTTPMTSFQQPFVPQDLWQMPMTIEWDWADMSNNFPVFGMDSSATQHNQS